MTGVRCFVAVELPRSMRDEIERIEEGLRMPGLRLVKPDLCHVTLKFLGDVPTQKIEEICETLRSVRVAPFNVAVSGMGAFPGRSVRVVWLGLKADFSDLFCQIEDSLSRLGFEPERRKFSPHVTLGRVGRPSQELSGQIATRLEQLAKVDLGSFSVDRFFLKKSTLTREGPIYEDLAEFLLQHPG
jgi:RNA 2',3'-cyclic 3'-phosphodiesterase